MRSLIVLFFLYFFLFISFFFLKEANLKNDFYIYIEDGDSLTSIKDKLADKNIFFPSIIDLTFFLSGRDELLRKGEYKINSTDNLLLISYKLYFGKINFRSFYIPEGAVLSSYLSKKEIKNFCLFKGFERCQLEGLLHPNTYFFELGDDINILLNKAFNRQLEIATSNFKKNNSMLPIKSIKELIIVASILEKESCPEERSIISGVIYNRLKKEMKLQIDSTVIYGIDNFDGDLTRKDLRKKTPFNSYTNYGLPPHPIASASESSIYAAANPSKHNFLYFVSKGNCEHYFSENYNDHLNAVKKYQLN